MDSKKLFRSLAHRQELARPLYIPLLGSFAARLRQVSVAAMFSNPTVYANALRDATRLFGFDAVVTSFDPALEAEALGCELRWEREDRLPAVVSHPLAKERTPADLDPEWDQKGRIPTVLEVTKRLTMLWSKEVNVLGAMAGPLALAGRLRGETFFSELKENAPRCHELLDFAGQCGVKLARLYAECKVDGLIVVEDGFHRIEDGATVKRLVATLQPLANLLEFFGIPLLLLARGCRREQVPPLLAAPVSGFILDVPWEEGRAPGGSIAGTISTELLLGDAAGVGEAVGHLLDRGRFFLSHEWEIPYHTPVQNIHEIMKGIKNCQRDKNHGLSASPL